MQNTTNLMVAADFIIEQELEWDRFISAKRKEYSDFINKQSLEIGAFFIQQRTDLELFLRATHPTQPTL